MIDALTSVMRTAADLVELHACRRISDAEDSLSHWNLEQRCNLGARVRTHGVFLGEKQMKPTAMLFRNMLSIDVEECIRAHCMDGVVLPGGCDKTTPGQLIGAASVDLPTIVVSAGPMLNGKWSGGDIGSGTDVRKFCEKVRAARCRSGIPLG